MKSVFCHCLVSELLIAGFPWLGTAQVCRGGVCFSWQAGGIQCHSMREPWLPCLCFECAAESWNSLICPLCRAAEEFVKCYQILQMFWGYSTVKEVFQSANSVNRIGFCVGYHNIQPAQLLHLCTCNFFRLSSLYLHMSVRFLQFSYLSNKGGSVPLGGCSPHGCPCHTSLILLELVAGAPGMWLGCVVEEKQYGPDLCVG